jgi:hypothetical protein
MAGKIFARRQHYSSTRSTSLTRMWRRINVNIFKNESFRKRKSGVDAMIICNFLRFSPIFGEKMAFLSKTNVMIICYQILAFCLESKTKFFADFLGENILKIITSVLD